MSSVVPVVQANNGAPLNSRLPEVLGRSQAYVREYSRQVATDAIYNQALNATQHARSQLSEREKDVTSKVGLAQRQLHAVRSRVMANEYVAGRHEWWAGAARYTGAVFAIAMTIMAFYVRKSISKNTMVALIVVLFVFYSISLATAGSIAKARRKDDWDRFYFRAVSSTASGNCSA